MLPNCKNNPFGFSEKTFFETSSNDLGATLPKSYYPYPKSQYSLGSKPNFAPVDLYFNSGTGFGFSMVKLG